MLGWGREAWWIGFDRRRCFWRLVGELLAAACHWPLIGFRLYRFKTVLASALQLTSEDFDHCNGFLFRNVFVFNNFSNLCDTNLKNHGV